jgi:hypothetical protein
MSLGKCLLRQELSCRAISSKDDKVHGVSLRLLRYQVGRLDHLCRVLDHLLLGHLPVGPAQVAAKPLLVVARAWNPSQASSLADPGPRGWVAAAVARHGAGPESGCSAQGGRSSRLPPSTSRSTTCANARHDRPPRPEVSNTAVPVHQVVRAMMPWAMADKRSPSGCGSISSQPVTMSRWPALMTQARASRRRRGPVPAR